MNYNLRVTGTLEPLFTTTVRPQPKYCVQTLVPYLQEDRYFLEKMQKPATEVAGQGDKSYGERLRDLCILCLRRRCTLSDTLDRFKIMENLSGIKGYELFTHKPVGVV